MSVDAGRGGGLRGVPKKVRSFMTFFTDGLPNDFDAECDDRAASPVGWDGVMGVKQGKWPLSG